MEARFLSTDGTLADKLMAALQGAKVRGADTRCDRYDKSSISAFLRIARPDDPDNDLYLDLNVNNTSGSTDPIDVLQDLYDDWIATASQQHFTAYHPVSMILGNYPNPFNHLTHISYKVPRKGHVLLQIYTSTGKPVKTLVNTHQNEGRYSIAWNGTDMREVSMIGGIYIAVLQVNEASQSHTLLLVR